MKDLYSKNYRTLLKKIEKDTERKKHSMLMNWKNYYCENVHATQGNVHVRCNPYQNTMDFLQRVGTNYLKISVESEKTLNSKGNIEK